MMAAAFGVYVWDRDGALRGLGLEVEGVEWVVAGWWVDLRLP